LLPRVIAAITSTIALLVIPIVITRVAFIARVVGPVAPLISMSVAFIPAVVIAAALVVM